MQAFCLAHLGQAYRMMGKYEESVTALRKALPFDVDSWVTHLQLAATYSELGKEKEAQAEVAEVIRTNPQMSLEILRRRNVQKDPVLVERTVAALRKAGLK
jgi:tetratricopeptide (TPR) repeat protein